MANTPQAKKRARQNEARFQVNKMRRSRIRTFLRAVEEAIASGDQAAAAKALQVAQPELMRGVTKGVVHKNTAARKMSPSGIPRKSYRISENRGNLLRITQVKKRARPSALFVFQTAIDEFLHLFKRFIDSFSITPESSAMFC